MKTEKIKKLAVLAMALTLAAVFTACASSAGQSVETEVFAVSPTGEAVQTAQLNLPEASGAQPAETAPSLIEAEKARTLVLEHLKDENAYIISCELDDGAYEIEVISGGAEYDYEVHAYTGQILKAEFDEYVTTPTTEQQELIGAEKAKSLVLEHLNDANAKITDCELDDGVYEIEVRSGSAEYDYKVDAYTGQILKAERDD